MKLREIQDYYLSNIAALVGNKNIILEEQGEGFKIKIQVLNDPEKILKTLSKLHWTIEKLQKVAKLQTDMSLELIIKESEV